jgi:hypothetical protein
VSSCVCSVVSLPRYIVSAYLQIAVSHIYVGRNGCNFFKASFRRAQSLIRELCVFRKLVGSSVSSLYCEREHQWVSNYRRPSAAGRKYSSSVTCRSRKCVIVKKRTSSLVDSVVLHIIHYLRSLFFIGVFSKTLFCVRS